MIWVTRLDGSQLMLNDDQVLFVDPAHDTVVTLANGNTLRVLESSEELADRIAHWRRRVLGLAIISADEFEEADPSPLSSTQPTRWERE